MTHALEFRSSFDVVPDALEGVFEGHASTFWRTDSYGTAFSPSAFRKTLAERGSRVPVLYQHNPDLNVGVPLRLEEDQRGLFVEAKLFDDGADGTVLLKRMRQGARFGMSFGFRTVKDREASDADPLDMAQMPDVDRREVRVIDEVRLYEVSVVSFPANEAAEIIAVRSQRETDALATVLDALRTGRLSSDQVALVRDAVAATGSEPPGEIAAALAEAVAQRRVDADAALARWKYLLP